MSNKLDWPEFGANIKLQPKLITSINFFERKKEVFIAFRSGNHLIMGFNDGDLANSTYHKILEQYLKHKEEDATRPSNK